MSQGPPSAKPGVTTMNENGLAIRIFDLNEEIQSFEKTCYDTKFFSLSNLCSYIQATGNNPQIYQK